jgi:hypothetical protein
VTRRAWTLLALGLVVSVAVGVGFARAGRPQCCSKSTASWNVFTPAQWKTVTLQVERRGFDASSVRVVATTEIASRRPFALVAATSRTGATCVTPVIGTQLHATTCRLAEPLLVFTAPETWNTAVPGTPARTVHLTAVLGIVRGDVNGVATLDHRGLLQGLPLMAAGRMGVFAGGFFDATSLRAYDAHNRMLAHVVLPAR